MKHIVLKRVLSLLCASLMAAAVLAVPAPPARADSRNEAPPAEVSAASHAPTDAVDSVPDDVLAMGAGRGGNSRGAAGRRPAGDRPNGSGGGRGTAADSGGSSRGSSADRKAKIALERFEKQAVQVLSVLTKGNVATAVTKAKRLAKRAAKLGDVAAERSRAVHSKVMAEVKSRLDAAENLVDAGELIDARRILRPLVRVLRGSKLGERASALLLRKPPEE